MFGSLSELGKKNVNFGNKVQLDNKVTSKCNVLSMDGVTAYGHAPKCHVTFWRVVLHEIPVSVITFLLKETISNVPGNIPSQEAY